MAPRVPSDLVGCVCGQDGTSGSLSCCPQKRHVGLSPPRAEAAVPFLPPQRRSSRSQWSGMWPGAGTERTAPKVPTASSSTLEDHPCSSKQQQPKELGLCLLRRHFRGSFSRHLGTSRDTNKPRSTLWGQGLLQGVCAGRNRGTEVPHSWEGTGKVSCRVGWGTQASL